MTESSYRDGARVMAPILPLAFVFGASFGLLARAEGVGAVAPIVMSLTIFAGSAQFAIVSILGAAGGAAAAIVAALLLNARYGAISIAIARGFRGGVVRRLAESQLIVDEAWALAMRTGRFDRGILVGGGFALYVCWNAGTAVGALGGAALGDPARLGLDAAFPALFLALLVPLVNTRRALAAAALGGAVALALMPVAPPGVPIVAAAAACVIGARR